MKVEIELTPEELAKKERKNQKKDELTREHDKIINEIEQSDQTCMGAALKKYVKFAYSHLLLSYLSIRTLSIRSI